MLQTIRPELRAFALVDFDPHGIAIMRTYRNGSQRLEHERDAAAFRLGWLGIRSDDIMSNGCPEPTQTLEDGGSPEPCTHESGLHHDFLSGKLKMLLQLQRAI